MSVVAAIINTDRITPYHYELNKFLKDKPAVSCKNFKAALKVYDNDWRSKHDKYSNASSEADMPDYGCSFLKEPTYSNLKKIGLTDEQIKAKCPFEAEYNSTIQDAYKKSGTKKTFAEWYKEWSTTEAGQMVIGGLKTGFASLWDKLFGTGSSSTNTGVIPPDEKEKTGLPFNMKPLPFAFLAIGTVALLSVIIYFIVRTPKKATT